MTTDSDWELRGRAWWSHVATLADDSMEGRETGSAGYRRAGDYVVERFRAAGLEPAGTDGFRQPVDFLVSQLDETASSLSLIRGGEVVPLPLREDAQFVVTSQTAPDAEADAVFVGYGLEIPEHGCRDLSSIDLRGKIAVFFRGGPSDLPGPIKAHFNARPERYRALRQAGAVGGIMMSNPNVPDLPWSRVATGLLQPAMELRDGQDEATRPPPMLAFFNPDHLDRLLAGSGHSAADLQRRLGGPDPLPRFPLASRIRAHVAVRHSTARCWNIAGVLRGSDPALREEYVVASAHLDHLGIGEPIGGDRVYSGAMDNASGVATLIEMARHLTASGQRPRRSLLFLAVTGEEKGLLGSDYFATHPTVLGPIVAELNMDMFLPLFPLKYLEVHGLDESSLGTDIRGLGESLGLEVDSDYEPERVAFVRSDQYSFVKTGVPALSLGVGYRKGTAEQRVSAEWFRDRYHAPADDLAQPVDRVAAARFTDFLGQLMMRVANAPDRPRWNPESFFRRFAQ